MVKIKKIFKGMLILMLLMGIGLVLLYFLAPTTFSDIACKIPNLCSDAPIEGVIR